jgi:SpoVK/Ycf46/Vps4 family AAA+-type ATPase
MIQSEVHDAAVSAAKASSHPTVEPRHVVYALARRYKDREGLGQYLAPAKAALEPAGNHYGQIPVSEAATAMIEALKTEDDGIAALKKALETSGDPSAGGVAGAQPKDAAEQPAGTPEAAPARAAETTAEILAELDALIGLGPVKAQVRRIIAVVQANTERKKAGLAPVNPGLHLVFTGPPGTGKTTVARIIARLYASTGALPGSKFTEAGRSDLIAGYVGQTAIKTREVIDRSKPGVLFIDEAYSLTPSSHVDFGHEAIATLVKAMEDFRDEFAVIVAGYEEEMDEFIGANPGLRSRFKTKIAFPDYNAAELTEIFSRMAADAGIGLADGSLAKAEQVFQYAAGRLDFGNARYARSLFEQAYTRMATRAAEDEVVTVEELGMLLPEDIHDDLSTLAPPPPRIGF